MNGPNVWKAVLSALVLAWAALNLFPVQDTQFEDFILKQAGAERESFVALLDRASERVARNPERSPSVYVALQQILREEKIDFSSFFPSIDLSDQRNIDKRNDILLRELLKRSRGKVKLGLDLKGGVAVTFAVNAEDLSSQEWERAEQLSQAKEIIASRVDGLGVAESLIRLKGDNRIEIQMPGISIKDNPDILETIGAPALLEFSEVHRTLSPMNSPEPPLGYSLMVQEVEDPRTGQISEIPQYVKTVPLMRGDIIRNAFAAPNEFGGFRIVLRFTDDGDRKFGDVTRRMAEENQRTNTIGQLAIILDGKLYSAPTVRSEIRGGAEITGRFSQREAVELANVLNNPLQVGLRVDELTEVGPSLATDARTASLWAAGIGGALVVVFMLFYYRLMGFVALATVAVNILIVVGTLSSFGATITLPGVAALVLTIGMAVDANILIFERMREELKVGKSIRAALTAGYDKAFSTIVDANLTTLLTGGILIWLGTGPIRGFGVTLCVGILTTMFCALITCRFLLDVLVDRGILTRALQFQFFRDSAFEFLRYARRAFTVSWAVVALGVVAFVAHLDQIFSIDFVGGDEITVSYQQPITSQQIAEVARSQNLGEVNAVFQTIIGSGLSTINIQTQIEQGRPVFEALSQAYPEAGLDLMGETRIGAIVGKEVKRSAIWSLALALIGILLYVALRFEWGYGIGAVVATVHDILMTIGIYVILGEWFGIGSGQFSSPMIAAILMVMGYSLNDTIVVFDRIREELTLNPGTNLRAVIHLAINRTLARTILTSVTTLLATLALFIFGAGIIVDFSLIFILGIITGTFSSMFIACPVLFWYHKGDRRKLEERHLLPTYDWASTPSNKEKAGSKAN